jgi:hypothetical protein
MQVHKSVVRSTTTATTRPSCGSPNAVRPLAPDGIKIRLKRLPVGPAANPHVASEAFTDVVPALDAGALDKILSHPDRCRGDGVAPGRAARCARPLQSLPNPRWSRCREDDRDCSHRSINATGGSPRVRRPVVRYDVTAKASPPALRCAPGKRGERRSGNCDFSPRSSRLFPPSNQKDAHGALGTVRSSPLVFSRARNPNPVEVVLRRTPGSSAQRPRVLAG